MNIRVSHCGMNASSMTISLLTGAGGSRLSICAHSWNGNGKRFAGLRAGLHRYVDLRGVCVTYASQEQG